MHSCKSVTPRATGSSTFIDAQTQPELFITTPSSTGTYIAIGLDLDAPFPGFFTALGPILHWIQPGLKAGPDGKLTSSEPFIANYIGPAPPPGSSPHRYSFFVYEQPDGLDIQKYAPADGKKLGNWNRMRFSLDDWEKEIKLGSVLAFNYFNSN